MKTPLYDDLCHVTHIYIGLPSVSKLVNNARRTQLPPAEHHLYRFPKGSR